MCIFLFNIENTLLVLPRATRASNNFFARITSYESHLNDIDLLFFGVVYNMSIPYNSFHANIIIICLSIANNTTSSNTNVGELFFS